MNTILQLFVQECKVFELQPYMESPLSPGTLSEIELDNSSLRRRINQILATASLV